MSAWRSRRNTKETDLKNEATELTKGNEESATYQEYSKSIGPILVRSDLCSVPRMLTDPFGTNRITQAIIGCAIRVHGAVGPGNPSYHKSPLVEGRVESGLPLAEG
jgi:hypothetical protein